MTITEFISKVNDIPGLKAEIVRSNGIMRNVFVMISLVYKDKDIPKSPLISVPVKGATLFDIHWFLGACNTRKPDVVSFDHSLLYASGYSVGYKENEIQGLIHRLYDTGIDERGLDQIKPEFYLRLGRASESDRSIYLMKPLGEQGVPFQLTHKENVKDKYRILWTEDELTLLKNKFPNLETAVEMMKEPAGDDN